MRSAAAAAVVVKLLSGEKTPTFTWPLAPAAADGGESLMLAQFMPVMEEDSA